MLSTSISSIERYIQKIFLEAAEAESQLILLVMLITMTVIVLDSVSLYVRHKRRLCGMSSISKVVAIEGSKTLPTKNYISKKQRLAGRPDALVEENGYIIPVECKPLARKLRDRHIAQLMVYMRLVEEFEGKRPPYGYLILGKNSRRVKIHNSLKRQEWLTSCIIDMQRILGGGTAVADPHPSKCRTCPVQSRCRERYREAA